MIPLLLLLAIRDLTPAIILCCHNIGLHALFVPSSRID
jgi:hypothetical protein